LIDELKTNPDLEINIDDKLLKEFDQRVKDHIEVYK
jgi:hypothetical protein